MVLLGDSTLDNGRWVAPGGFSVTEHLKLRLGQRRVTNCAVDGAMLGAVGGQLAGAPNGATHLVLSVGGNDGLGMFGELEAGGPRALLSPLALYRGLWRAMCDFEAVYARTLVAVVAWLAAGKAANEAARGGTGQKGVTPDDKRAWAVGRVVVCTVYRPMFHQSSPGYRLQRSCTLVESDKWLFRRLNSMASSLLTMWTLLLLRVGTLLMARAVERQARKIGVPSSNIVHLNHVMTQVEDFANPIEPSSAGGRKIANAICAALGAEDEQGIVARAPPLSSVPSVRLRTGATAVRSKEQNDPYRGGDLQQSESAYY